MKSARTLITICLLFTAATLFAQTENHQLMTVKVPFSFSVQDHSLPAGEYNIFTVLPERAIRITSTDGRHSAIVNTLPNYANSVSESSRLIFHRYGDEYFLAQVWTLGQTVGRNPISSQRAMDLASNGSSRQTWTVLAEANRR
jgi:hypothetical protein